MGLLDLDMKASITCLGSANQMAARKDRLIDHPFIAAGG
jgi:hypothetical protein